ncbi:class I SAM-dependent methyltransferase [uncultured Tateyamaria sp.]|uniref:SAM-dependent methyltransferase n=1 Tax=uncultured Tateyamaria sp. TaxID=455651 RepID=UPI0026313A21|nr:class I SAM-dependent methyltransferase [uncultured Tateyamaria sp.]
MVVTTLVTEPEPNIGFNLEPDEQQFRKFVRFGLEAIVRSLNSGTIEDRTERHRKLEKALGASPITKAENTANAQHYEVPTAFFQAVLGPHLKYSACYFRSPENDLAAAEEAALEQVCSRAQLEDGQRVLDLGCGWGANSLFIAERFPRSSVVALSNSTGQRRFIESAAADRGLTNLSVITASVAEVEFEVPFDRIVSIEMMEHVRNWPALLNQMRAWLTPEGLAFVHVFSHREHGYLFDGVDVTAQHYFSGGFMPSDRLIYCFCDALKVKDHWAFDGTHYARTARSWLERLEANREAVLAIFEDANDASIALNNYHHWRNFFALVEESFGFRNGCEWIISQYLLTPQVRGAAI